MLGRLGGFTVRARLIVLGATLSILLAVVAAVAITGVSSIKSAYNADQIPAPTATWPRRVRGLADSGRPDQHVRRARRRCTTRRSEASLMATWKQVHPGPAQIENQNLALLAKGHLTPKQWAIFHEITTQPPDLQRLDQQDVQRC